MAVIELTLFNGTTDPDEGEYWAEMLVTQPFNAKKNKVVRCFWVFAEGDWVNSYDHDLIRQVSRSSDG